MHEYLSLFFLYFASAAGLVMYGFNCYVMIFIFKRHRRSARERAERVMERFERSNLSEDEYPKVTTQIPVFNEYNVVERIMIAAAAMEYPAGRHEIQILDDSTDETSGLIDLVAERLVAKGHDIKVIRREERTGFKAGALSHGMETATGKLIAIFDADFLPPKDYLLRTLPFFLEDRKTGLVQARWGHINREASLLTRAQSIGIDGHFMVEQSARNFGGLYMNFNGTAGTFRKEAIEEAGGWQWDTLTEDMDLSYRVQFAGWQTVFLPDLVVPAEIPEDMNAFKTQQFRWAKGSIQTARKLLPYVILSRVPLFKKVQAFFHMTHYMVHPLMLLVALLALPVILTLKAGPGPVLFGIAALLLLIAMAAPSTLYMVAQRHAYGDRYRNIRHIPFLVIVGTGIAVSNTKAVMEALAGFETPFIRTPKKGDKEKKQYNNGFSPVAFIEIAAGLYCALSLGFYLTEGKYLIGPFLAVYTMGFLFTGTLTLYHSAASQR